MPLSLEHYAGLQNQKDWASAVVDLCAETGCQFAYQIQRDWTVIVAVCHEETYNDHHIDNCVRLEKYYMMQKTTEAIDLSRLFIIPYMSRKIICNSEV